MKRSNLFTETSMKPTTLNLIKSWVKKRSHIEIMD